MKKNVNVPHYAVTRAAMRHRHYELYHPEDFGPFTPSQRIARAIVVADSCLERYVATLEDRIDQALETLCSKFPEPLVDRLVKSLALAAVLVLAFANC